VDAADRSHHRPARALNRKGIIHTVSYQRAKDLMTASEHKSWMMVHDTYNLKDTIQQFKQSTGPWILVSPSIVTGYDFKATSARYQIIGKIPFPDMRGVFMSTRKDLDPTTGYLAMMKLIQACGRIVRGPSDWGETFIVDDHFLWFVKTCKALGAPRWFLNAIVEFESLPDPLFA
jgi:ATP-dependent DNA helicase DinG